MIAKNIKQAMAAIGITQFELCEKTGISKSSMSEYLSGRHEPKDDKLKLIAEALKVSVDELKDDNETLIEIPKERPVNVPVKVAAKLMGISVYGIGYGIERGTLPIGHVYGCGTKHKAFYISPYKLQQVIGANIWD